MRDINKIIIHCSDSDNPAHDSVKTIRDWHMRGRGWIDIGYHYVITYDGMLQVGRDIAIPGAHCKGQNIDSLGICVTGKWRFSTKQMKALNYWVKEFIKHHSIHPRNVFPHNHFNKNKTCPNFLVEDYYVGSKQEKMG